MTGEIVHVDHVCVLDAWDAPRCGWVCTDCGSFTSDERLELAAAITEHVDPLARYAVAADRDPETGRTTVVACDYATGRVVTTQVPDYTAPPSTDYGTESAAAAAARWRAHTDALIGLSVLSPASITFGGMP